MRFIAWLSTKAAFISLARADLLNYKLKLRPEVDPGREFWRKKPIDGDGGDESDDGGFTIFDGFGKDMRPTKNSGGSGAGDGAASAGFFFGSSLSPR